MFAISCPLCTRIGAQLPNYKHDYSLRAKHAISIRSLHSPRLLYQRMQPRCLPWLSCYTRLLQPGCFLSPSRRFAKTTFFSEKAVSLSVINPRRTRQLLPSRAHTGHIQGWDTGSKTQDSLLHPCALQIYSTSSSPLWPAGSLGAAALAGQAPGSAGRHYSSVQPGTQATRGTHGLWKQRVTVLPPTLAAAGMS